MKYESISSYLKRVKSLLKLNSCLIDNDQRAFLNDDGLFHFSNIFTNQAIDYIKNDQRSIFGVFNNKFLDFDLFCITLSNLSYFLHQVKTNQIDKIEGINFRTHDDVTFKFSLDFLHFPVIEFKKSSDTLGLYYEFTTIHVKPRCILRSIIKTMLLPYSFTSVISCCYARC